MVTIVVRQPHLLSLSLSFFYLYPFVPFPFPFPFRSFVRSFVRTN